MNWLRRKIRAWLNADLHLEKSSIQDDQSPRLHKGLRIIVCPASGGTIIEAQPFDHMSPNFTQSTPAMYVIHSDQDLAKEISKIITIQGLKG